MYSPGMIERTKRDIIDPIFKKKLKWNELDEAYYRQLEMDTRHERSRRCSF